MGEKGLLLRVVNLSYHDTDIVIGFCLQTISWKSEGYTVQSLKMDTLGFLKHQLYKKLFHENVHISDMDGRLPIVKLCIESQ